ncbi:glycosyltransferase family 4 protein [Lyngbya sp. PCC 8106]|uniref:glycosyltransferase family 4 protein n=1 Tax=Lyngbya sp. (strain PCC 8106) TaxID=313612 RepID=UPI0000EA9EDF|nr:glycosyltransferase family 4 protein [Lyngbya sp. PCC 8106]EAW38933.1 Glycosyl transferase, group 1 [Lyngbya sp. PCC 8106]
MKISVVVGDLSSSGAGRWGGAVRPFLLSQALQQLNLEVEMVGFVQNEDQPVTTNTQIPIISVPRKHNFYPQFFISAQQLLRQITGDIIYAYKPKPTSWGLSLIKKWQTHRPVILDIDDWELSWHGGDQWKYSPTFRQLARDVLKPDGALRQPDYPFYLKWMESLVSKADVITTHNQFLQKRFGGVYVPNGKDVHLFDPAKYNPQDSRSRYGLSEYRILMFPGAPRPYKGVEDVLMALDRLDQPDLRLVIVGGSPYDNYDQELTDKWGRWIIKIPKSPSTEMPGIVAAAHIIVIPQRDSPAAQAQFPLKLTDGMAMAKPILSTRVGDIPEILGDTGYIVDPESPEQLAESIQSIFTHWEEAEAKGKQARLKCTAQYSLEAMSAILSDVIAKVSSQ